MEASTLARATPFSSLSLDSLEFLELIQQVEQLTGEKITDTQIIGINTVGDLFAAVGC